MQFVEKAFGLMALVGMGLVGKTYYEKHYVTAVPKNSHLIVTDRMKNKYATNQQKVLLIPYWQQSQLITTKEKYEIKSKASTKDKQVVNVHVLVDSWCSDPVKAYEKFGKDINNAVKEELAKDIKLLSSTINSKQYKAAQLSTDMQKKLDKTVKSLNKAGVNMTVKVLNMTVNPPLRVRHMPQLL